MDFLGRSSRMMLSPSLSREGQVRERGKDYSRSLYRCGAISRSRSSVVVVCSVPAIVSSNVAVVHRLALEIRAFPPNVASTPRVSHCGDFGGQSRADRRGIISRSGENEKRRRVMGGSRSSRETGNSVTSSLGLAAVDRFAIEGIPSISILFGDSCR